MNSKPDQHSGMPQAGATRRRLLGTVPGLAFALCVAACGTRATALPSPVPSVARAPVLATATLALPLVQVTPTRAPSVVETVTPDLAANRILLRLGSYHFIPSELTAHVGKPLRLDLENSDTLLHEFSLENYELSVMVEPRTATKLDLLFKSPGIYRFACTLVIEGDHRSLGMRGTIIVEP